MPSRDLRLVYAVTEAAELLGIGRSTAYELAQRSELATTQLGSRVVVTRPTLTSLLGIEPPLPSELDPARPAAARAERRTAAARTAASRHRPTVDAQTHLPFTD